MFGIAAWSVWGQWYFAIALALSGYYVYLMYRYFLHWNRLADWTIPSPFIPDTKISVLISARNESANIKQCVESILRQNYPPELFEIIVIDDHSTDDTAELVEQMAVENSLLKLLKLGDCLTAESNQAFKKKAIEQGIAQAFGDLIVCTDADCLVPKEWLRLIASFYQNQKPVFIAAPVNFHQEQSSFERFQSLDFIGMMGITGAGIQGSFQHMCNGANLAYEKKAFYEVSGFKGIDDRASGDDMLLLQKMTRRFPQQISFLKNREATVLTKAMPTLSAFAQQRIRWASKSRDYPEWQVTFRLAMVFLLCWSILLSILLLPFQPMVALPLFVLQLGSKMLVDYFFLKEMSLYFGREDLMKGFFSAALWHLGYIAVIGLLANLSRKYEWKGRKVR